MAKSNGKPVDLWKRLKKLTKERKKIVERLKRVNESISVRAAKLNALGEKYGQLTFAIDKLKDEMSEDQMKLITQLIETHSVQINKLTNDIGELSEPNILLFAEFEEVESEINALTETINAEKPEQSEKTSSETTPELSKD